MSFQYQPLPQGSKVIRLLELQPGRGKATIQCKLKQFSLASQSLAYEPLSYCWGDPRWMLPIHLDGYPMEVTRNLHAALLHLRREDSIRLLWVDAVCINQNDVSEKSEQIQMMRQIYQQGVRTLVWLGKLPLRARKAFRYVQDLSNASETSPLETDHPYLVDVRALLELPYFTRVWVVQEIAVSSSVQIFCGPNSISWDDLATAVSMANELGPRDYGEAHFYYMRSFTRFASMSYTRSMFQANNKLDWLRLLAEHKNCSATNAKDKVYALLGLADPVEVTTVLGIVPNYRKEYTAVEAFTDTAVSILKVSGNLDLLSIPRSSTSGLSELCLPTWVPDWSRPSMAYALPPISSIWSFAATGESSSHPVFRDASRLGLLGYVFDEVGWITHGSGDKPAPHLFRFDLWFSEFAETMRFVTKNVRAWKNWRHEMGLRCAEHYVNGESIPRVFWRTFTGGRSFENENDEVQAYREWEEFIGNRKGPSGVLDRTFIWMIYVSVWIVARELSIRVLGAERPTVKDDFVSMSYGRSMFVSKDGYIGLGPSGIHVGDCLAFLEGGRAPYVLRRRDIYYELVGDCYIHGVMQGEIFDSTKSESIWLG
ncbi:hypothetical protein AAE478_004216 [Parahypoxylon ruwenzoriense]